MFGSTMPVVILRIEARLVAQVASAQTFVVTSMGFNFVNEELVRRIQFFSASFTNGLDLMRQLVAINVESKRAANVTFRFLDRPLRRFNILFQKEPTNI